MTNIKTFNSKEEIQQQACDWISRIDRGLSLDEHQALQRWTMLSESHRQILFDMAQTWDDLSVLNELSGLMPLERIEPITSTKTQSTVFWPMAASVAFVVSVLVGWLVFNVDPTNNKQHPLTTLTSNVGEQKPVTLSDGSVVYLNTNSEVVIDFSANERQIHLVKGEAHFDVAHNENRPFVVTAAHNSVTAVGTAFNVQLLNDQRFELLVTEGKVLVKNALQQNNLQSIDNNLPALEGEGTLLVAGQKAWVDDTSTESINLSLEQMQNDLAWRQGIVVFHGEPLFEALSEISRYTPIHFKLADDNVKQQRVAGFFKAGDIDGLLSALKNNFNIMYQKLDGQTILLSSAL